MFDGVEDLVVEDVDAYEGPVAEGFRDLITFYGFLLFFVVGCFWMACFYVCFGVGGGVFFIIIVFAWSA